MPTLTSVSSTQKKFEPGQGRLVGEQHFENLAKLMKVVDISWFIHPNVRSLAHKVRCHTRANPWEIEQEHEKWEIGRAHV